MSESNVFPFAVVITVDAEVTHAKQEGEDDDSRTSGTSE